jgi:hypothetical protein
MTARAGRRTATSAARSRAPRPAGSWPLAIERAREAWDDLTGGPNVEFGAMVPPGSVRVMGPDEVVPPRLVYSDMAAAVILETALGLWSDVVASLGADDDDG